MIKNLLKLLVIIIVCLVLIFIFKSRVDLNAEIRFIVLKEDGEVYLKIKSRNDSKVYYTLDGSIPSTNSILYKGKIKIDNNTSPNTLSIKDNADKIYGREILYNESLPKGVVVRAITYDSSYNLTDIYTKTVFPNIDLENYFPNTTVVSLVTDPNNLLDYENGIMVKGKIYDEYLKNNNKTISKDEELVESEIVDGNFMQHGKEWEREGNIEIFEPNNNKVINQNSGFRIKGNISRMYNQKSLNIYFREDYGKDNLEYELFSDLKDLNNKKITSFKSITLRNGGNDTEHLKFKDSWLQSLVKDRNVDTQMSKPAVLFINGEYWGVYSLEEKYSKDYYATHYNLDRDNIIVIKEHELEEGEEEDFSLYEELMSYAEKDLTDEKNYKEFLELIDLESMLDYFAIQTYINNNDWGIEESGYQKNVMLWRTREKENNKYGDTKWRYSLYDLEFSSSLYGIKETGAKYCAIESALKKHPLFASAMKNKEFNDKFYETYFELKRINFNIEKVEKSLNEMFLRWEPLMKNHYKRFGDYDNARIASRNSLRNYFKEKIYSNPC